MRQITALALFTSHLLFGANGDAALAGLKAALSSNNAQEARVWEQRLVTADTSADTLLIAGALLAQQDMLPEAVEIFERCTQRFPASFEAKYNLTLARIGLNNYPAAEASLHSIAPASARETSAVQYLQGKICAATGRPAEARRSLESAYHGNPNDENYALDLALFYLRSSAYIPAVQVLQQATARHPESENLALELALSDALAGRSSDALLVCRKLLLPTARVIAAFANCLSSNYQACESEAVAGLARPNPNPYLHYLYAEALWNLDPNNHPKALNELNTAVSQMPNCSVCLLLRSRVLESAHDDPAAIADLKTLLGTEPESAQAWYRLSALYRKNGNTAEAAEAMRHYRALNERQTNAEIETFRNQFLGSFDKPTNE